jgi:phage repressor protein C with HTH and peptisase S24 domain
MLSSNLKLLREKCGLNQDEMQAAIELEGKTRWSDYERGKSKPPIDVLLKISDFFQIDVRKLYESDLSKARFEGKNLVDEFEQKGKVQGRVQGKVSSYFETKSPVISILGEPENNYGNKLIPITDIRVAAGSGIYAPESVENVDFIGLPQHLLRKPGTYLCVRIKGESMAPTLQDGGYMVIRQLDHSEWASASKKQERIYVVTDAENKGYLKRLKNRLDKGFIVCMSDNPDKASHPNFNLMLEDITGIWEAEWYISARMPNIHDVYYTKVQKLEDNMEDLKANVARLMKTLPSS